jgi:hypothetical protein
MAPNQNGNCIEMQLTLTFKLANVAWSFVASFITKMWGCFIYFFTIKMLTRGEIPIENMITCDLPSLT